MNEQKHRMAHAAQLRADAHVLLAETVEQALALYQQSVDESAALHGQVNDALFPTFVESGRRHLASLQRQLEAERHSVDFARGMQERWEQEANQ